MNYHWTDCPGCGCHVAVNWTLWPDRVSGSLRRWSYDRSINDGRPFEIAAASLPAEGGFTTGCVCGRELAVPAQGVQSRGSRTEG